MTACCLSGNGQSLFAANKPAQEERPNILFILSDDHTSQSWGIYGGVLGEYARNENIRRLAAEGCVLDNCFCTNSISSPSRAAILTGAYSHVNGVYTLSDSFDPEQDNIAKQMRAGGYQTALVGKWHLKTQPQGFDFYSVFHDQGEYRDPTFINCTDPWPGERNFGERVRGFSTDIVTDKAIRWMKEADKDRPFMMCCHFKATHEPWDFPERMRHLYDGVVFPEPENLFDWGPETMDVPSPDSLWRSWLVVGTWRRKTLINGGAGIRSCLLRRRACIDLPPVAPLTRNWCATICVAGLRSTIISGSY